MPRARPAGEGANAPARPKRAGVPAGRATPQADDESAPAELPDGRREAGEPEGPSAEPTPTRAWDDRAG